jgi:hypothetical protein
MLWYRKSKRILVSVTTGDVLLLETGDKLLLETGDAILIEVIT